MTDTQLVVADAGPIHYLVLTGDVDLLAAMFGRVIAPARVRDELSHIRTRAAVRAWIEAPLRWLNVRAVENPYHHSGLETLNAGEREAIALTLEISADLLLIDNRIAVRSPASVAWPSQAPWGCSTSPRAEGSSISQPPSIASKQPASIIARVYLMTSSSGNEENSLAC